MTGVDPDVPVPSERGAKPRECRGVPSLHDDAGATAVQSKNRSTNRSHRQATYDPNSESAATAERATVFGQLGLLSGKSRLKVLIVGVGEPSFYVT